MHDLEKCTSLQQVRQNIDRLDDLIMPLLCERIKYILQAAQFKISAEDTRRFDRIETIITKAKNNAAIAAIDEDYIESVYRHLIDESIRLEKKQWQKTMAINK